MLLVCMYVSNVSLGRLTEVTYNTGLLLLISQTNAVCSETVNVQSSDYQSADCAALLLI